MESSVPAVRRQLLSLICLAAAAGSAGCFYTDPINSRPTVEVQKEGVDAVFRTESLAVRAKAGDPDGDGYSIDWTAVACGPGGVPCKVVSVFPDLDDEEVGHIPVPLVVEGTEIPVFSIDATAVVTDSYGATATDSLPYDIGNRAPTITLTAEGYLYQNAFPIDLPVAIVATTEDMDEDRVTVEGEWPPPVGPPGSEGLFDWVRDGSRDDTYLFTPHAVGSWNFTVGGQDATGTAAGPGQLSLTSADDLPPCIVGPLTPPIGNTFTLFEDHSFSIATISDDLDIYPLPTIDPPSDFHGTAHFRWSLASPDSGGIFVPLPDTDNSVELVWGDFDPSDHLQLRAEVYDRRDRSIDCPVGQPTCAIGADQSCLQRQTWEIVVQ
jgi:hypothetical protein